LPTPMSKQDHGRPGWRSAQDSRPAPGRHWREHRGVTADDGPPRLRRRSAQRSALLRPTPPESRHLPSQRHISFEAPEISVRGQRCNDDHSYRCWCDWTCSWATPAVRRETGRRVRIGWSGAAPRGAGPGRVDGFQRHRQCATTGKSAPARAPRRKPRWTSHLDVRWGVRADGSRTSPRPCREQAGLSVGREGQSRGPGSSPGPRDVSR